MKNLFLLFCLVFCFACNEKTNTAKMEALPLEENLPSTTTAINIPIYEKFDELEPFFHLQNDTTYIINFWATWCKPCVAELPYFEQLHQQYKNDKVKVILVSLDFKKQIQSKLIPFIIKNKIQSKVVLLDDPKANQWIDKVDPAWDGAIPVSVVYKNDNRQFIGGEVADYAELENILLNIKNQN